MVHPKRHAVKVTNRVGDVNIYGAGQEIPLFFGGSVAVDAIFA
jgi:hypothetical protein